MYFIICMISIYSLRIVKSSPELQEHYAQYVDLQIADSTENTTIGA